MRLICFLRGYFCVLIVMQILTENILKITQKISTERSLKNLYFERLFEHKRCNA